jgi:hypothetical protein
MALRPTRRRVVAALAIGVALAVIQGQTAGAAPRPKPTTTTTAAGDKSPPTAPTNLRVTATTKTSVSLAWDPSTDNSGTFDYSVRQDGYLSWTVSQFQTSFQPTWLSPGRTYTFQVFAVDGQLNTVRRQQHRHRHHPARRHPPTAFSLTVYDVSPSQSWLSWTEATDDIWPSSVGYTIYLNGAPVTALNWINIRNVSLRHLAPGTAYTIVMGTTPSAGSRPAGTRGPRAPGARTPPCSHRRLRQKWRRRRAGRRPGRSTAGRPRCRATPR